MFQIGDQVTVVAEEPPDKKSLDLGWNSEMNAFLGKTATVVQRNAIDGDPVYRLAFGKQPYAWWWAEHWLLPAPLDVDVSLARKRDENLRKFFCGE